MKHRGQRRNEIRTITVNLSQNPVEQLRAVEVLSNSEALNFLVPFQHKEGLGCVNYDASFYWNALQSFLRMSYFSVLTWKGIQNRTLSLFMLLSK